MTKTYIHTPYREYDKEDPRYSPNKGYYKVAPTKVPRQVYSDVDSATISSMIKLHSLDGSLRMFATYLITGKIVNNAEDILASFGIAAPKTEPAVKKDQFAVDTEDKEEDGADFGSWVI